uniref:Uncharacterized protein n=1 Tax=Tetradesmus obliquus TaxID=3088 RepID=A0A383VM73_TETOB|eukprot:jgi/Sobl393_1/15661/SZX65919.1
MHTGDWKIDEDPVDGEAFDRTTFDLLSKEPISLMMSDSTNVLSLLLLLLLPLPPLLLLLLLLPGKEPVSLMMSDSTNVLSLLLLLLPRLLLSHSGLSPGKEPISLMMSDSTNVLSPGRTPGEKIVQESLAQKVLDHQGKGRVVVTQFASNLHRLASVKAAADAAGRGICFIGTSLNTYLEAAYRDGRAPLSPSELIKPDQLPHMDPNKVLIVTTGSQAEPRAQLSLASRSASNNLKISPQDLILYSAKVIPGNETKVSEMLNSLALQGAHVVAGRADNLHVSGHAYQGELEEVLRFVKPQHFLPVHGEYSFLVEHARLAKERAGVLFTEVIKNGQMLGVHERRNRNTISTGSMAAATVKAEAAAAAAAAEAEQGTAQDEPRSGISVIGEVDLLRLFNDGGKGTGTATEMALAERETLAFEGVIVVAVDVIRPKAAMSSGGWAGAAGGAAAAAAGGLSCKARLTTRAMWTDQGKLLDTLHQAVNSAVSKLPGDASLGLVERNVTDACMRASRWFNNRKPEVIVVAYEHDPRSAVMVDAASRRREQQQPQQRPGRRDGAATGMPWQQQQQQQQYPRQQQHPRQQQPAQQGPPAMQQQQQQQPPSLPQQQPAAAPAAEPAAAAAAARKVLSRAAPRARSSRSSSSSSSTTTSDSSSSSSSTTASPGAGPAPVRRAPVRRTRRSSAAAAAALPPLQVLPEGVDVPAYKNNPRQNPDAASSGSDLAYD